MEIATTSRRTAYTPWGRLLVLVLVLAPFSVLVLLPIGLGLQRYVMTSNSMDGGIDEGSVVFVRTVPVGDLRVGDVISYSVKDPQGDEDMVTHRIISIDRGVYRTQGDASSDPDPWTLRPGATLERVVFVVPWLGEIYAVFHPRGWVVTLGLASLLVALMVGQVLRGRRGATLVEREPAHVGG